MMAHMIRHPAGLLLIAGALLAGCFPSPGRGAGDSTTAGDPAPEVLDTGAEPAESASPDATALAALIEALGDLDPARRDAAERQLDRGGEAALEALRAASLAPDPERDVRMGRLVRRLSSVHRLVRRMGSRRAVAISPDGETAVAYDVEGGYVLENVRTGVPSWKRLAAVFESAEPLLPCFRPGGAEVLVQTGPGLLESLSVKDGTTAHVLRFREPAQGLGAGRICVAGDRVFIANGSGVYPIPMDTEKVALDSLTGMRSRLPGSAGKTAISGLDAAGNLVAFRGSHLGFYDPKTLKLITQPERLDPPCDFMGAPSDTSILYLVSRDDGSLRTFRSAPPQPGPPRHVTDDTPTCLAVSGDGLTLAIGTLGNLVFVLHAEDFSPCAELVLPDPPDHITLSDDGSVLGVSAGDGISLFARPVPGR